MDCGRILSDRARLDTVAGPSFSRRSRTDTWDGVRSRGPACSRSRRFSFPTSERRSSASAPARADGRWSDELIMSDRMTYMKIDCKDNLRSSTEQNAVIGDTGCRTDDIEKLCEFADRGMIVRHGVACLVLADRHASATTLRTIQH